MSITAPVIPNLSERTRRNLLYALFMVTGMVGMLGWQLVFPPAPVHREAPVAAVLAPPQVVSQTTIVPAAAPSPADVTKEDLVKAVQLLAGLSVRLANKGSGETAHILNAIEAGLDRIHSEMAALKRARAGAPPKAPKAAPKASPKPALKGPATAPPPRKVPPAPVSGPQTATPAAEVLTQPDGWAALKSHLFHSEPPSQQ